MQQVAWASAVVGAAVLLAGCSDGDGGLASSQDVVVKTVVVTPTVTASGSASPTASSPTATTATTATATATVTATATAAQTAAGSSAGGASGSANGPGAPSPSASSAQVANVQVALKRSGYYSGTVDGVEGAGTTAAVKAFQRDHGLVADGVAGSSFWAAVNGGSAPRATSTPTQAAPQEHEMGSSGECAADYAAWDAAVQAGRRSAANSAHARGQAHGCRPNTWLPSRATTKHDPVNTHQVGDACSMSEIGTYDAAGNVCTQDVTDHPHWN